MQNLSGKHIVQGTLWLWMVIVITAVVTVVIYTNTTLRSIEKNLPSTLLTELNSLSNVLEKISDLVSSARIANSNPNPQTLEQLRITTGIVNKNIIDLRDTYVVNNLINASAFHAVVAPAIADLEIWLVEGISGYQPNSPIILDIVETRISEAFQKASNIKFESQIHAQKILDKQRSRLEKFLSWVNTLFVLTIIIVCCLIFLIIRQSFLRKREIQTQNILQKERDLLHSLLHNLPLGVTVCDHTKNIIHINKCFSDMTGYRHDDIQHLEKWPQLAYPDPEYRKQVREHWKKAARSGAMAEYKVTCKNGNVKDIEFRATFLPDSRVINTLTDVTGRNKAEDALQASREIKSRSKKMESLGLLAGGVAHDLNNILSGIVSYPELILLDLKETDKLRKPIEIMYDSGLKATAIVQDLLTVARGVAIAKEPLNINSTIQDYLKSHEFEFIRQFHPKINIEISLTDDLFNISGSRAHIRKILMNLVSNSCEAIDGNGHVLISTANSFIDFPFHGYNDVEEGDYVLLSVADRGKGISKEDLDRIFEPFYSKKVMGRSGTGLGLAVVWNVVQDHNGYINVLSNDEGTTFCIYFPITHERISEQESLLDIDQLRGDNELILIVDDISSQRHITESIVKKLGYQVETVPNGEAAVEFIKKRSVDLLLLDMIMEPGINGRETYEKVLKINPVQKAIITSGFSETDDVKKTLKLGAGCYLKKPLTIQELGVALQEELKKQFTNS